MESKRKIGFTTGSCVAAAAKAACYMLLTGKKKDHITIVTPKGIPFSAEVVDIVCEETWVRCAVVKDGGDDPDVTTGLHMTVTVSLSEECGFMIEGGDGIGRVTKPGLDQPVGNAAINHVPREMMEKEVQEVCTLCDYHGGIHILVEAPGGAAIAEQTFNPRLGITGGISVLGTSGVVEPMSMQALKDTIQVELRQQRAMGRTSVAMTPGNYGLDFMKNTYDYDLDKSVKCSNFIGDAIDMAAEVGIKKLLLTGHIGKLIKVSGGIMNTHSKEADCRMELLVAAALQAGASTELAAQLLTAVTTEEGVRLLREADLLEDAMTIIMDKIMFYLEKRAAGRLQIECMVYANQEGLLAKSQGAEALLNECKNM